jgi:predicted GTPase
VERKRVVIMGAAGRDFHNFNLCYREDDSREVVAFTATQIPGIHGRRYPAELAGRLYPQGIPIVEEGELPALIERHRVAEVVFSYSDISHEDVMHKASLANACGADFILLGVERTMIRSRKPVVSICAVRTGAGKSQTTRRVCAVLEGLGRRVAVIRHPMPYGDLVRQRVQRFATLEDMDRHECTVEEREEYEPHIVEGRVLFAGVDYGDILAAAEAEADVIVWDGGNNDTSFYRPDLLIVVADPHRPEHGLRYHPGETNLRMADVVVINKEDSARREDIETVVGTVRLVNPGAVIIHARSPFTIDRPERLKGKRVIVVEDGPTLTHGGMEFGVGVKAAESAGVKEMMDPRPFAQGEIAGVFRKYAHLTRVLPAMGYSPRQLEDLRQTLVRAKPEAVVVATPIDLGRLIHVDAPMVRVRYDLEEIGSPNLGDVLKDRLALT